MTLTLQEATGKNVVLLPLGACDDGAHSQNEKMDRKNYIEGVSITGNKGNTMRIIRESCSCGLLFVACFRCCCNNKVLLGRD